MLNQSFHDEAITRACDLGESVPRCALAVLSEPAEIQPMTRETYDQWLAELEAKYQRGERP